MSYCLSICEMSIYNQIWHIESQLENIIEIQKAPCFRHGAGLTVTYGLVWLACGAGPIGGMWLIRAAESESGSNFVGSPISLNGKVFFEF